VAPRKKPDDARQKPPTSPDPQETTDQGSPGSPRSTPAGETAASTRRATPPPTAENPFEIETPPSFEPGDGRPNLESDLDDELDEIDPHLFDWTPERAGAVIRAGGYVLHTADRMGHVDGGEELWKATEADARAAGEPLARILNRYDGARRLAGMVDEAEFAAAMFDYARRNLAHRGQLVRRDRALRQEEPQAGPAAFDSMAGDPRQPPPVYVVPDPDEVSDRLEFDDSRFPEDPAQPADFAFDPWATR
jgi:hypothetical protein